MDIGRAIRRPPTDSTMVDISDSEDSVQSTLQVVVVERAFAPRACLPQPLLQHGLPVVSGGSCIVKIADGTWKRLPRSKLARQNVALCSTNGLPKWFTADVRQDVGQGAVVVS